MAIRILCQRVLHLLTSTLALLAQRLPFLKHLSPLLSSPSALRIATPLTASFAGTHSLSGQSVEVTPLSNSFNPATATVGEPFLWQFKTSNHNAGSFTTTGLPIPDNINYEFGIPFGELSLPGGTISGTPLIPGTFQVTIRGHREPDFSGEATEIYLLIVEVKEPSSSNPFQNWRNLQWTGDDATNNAISGPQADPDDDGIQNLLEFFLDLNPTQPDNLPGELKVDPSDSSRFLYQLPMNTDARELDFKFQRSTSLKADEWTDISPSDPDYQVTITNGTITLRFPKGSTKEYIRLSVAL